MHKLTISKFVSISLYCCCSYKVSHTKIPQSQDTVDSKVLLALFVNCVCTMTAKSYPTPWGHYTTTLTARI